MILYLCVLVGVRDACTTTDARVNLPQCFVIMELHRATDGRPRRPRTTFSSFRHNHFKSFD